MSANGYYKCSCGKTYLSEFPYQEANCMGCGKKVQRLEIIKGNYSRVLKKLKAEGRL